MIYFSVHSKNKIRINIVHRFSIRGSDDNVFVTIFQMLGK